MTAGYGSTSDAAKRLREKRALEQACESTGRAARVPETAPDALTGNLDRLSDESHLVRGDE